MDVELKITLAQMMWLCLSPFGFSLERFGVVECTGMLVCGLVGEPLCCCQPI